MRREGLAALVLANLALGSALAEPSCPGSEAGDTLVTGVTGAGALVTERGEEVVLAGLVFPQVYDMEEEYGAAPDLTAEIARRATGPARVAPVGSHDRYGRIHADVVTGHGTWLQAELVAAGLALVRPEGDTTCVHALLALEQTAREARTGLWSDSKIIAKATDQPSLLAKSGLYALVEGRVVSVGYGSRMVFLDFGRSFRTDFTVMVPKTLVPRLVEAGITVESLAGRAIRVRGVIEESGGPAIRITDPLAFELLDREE
jgi:micrococcal nuclease